MYIHTLYVSNHYHNVRDYLTKSLSDEYGGCTLVHARGYWNDKPTDVVPLIEPVSKVECIHMFEECPIMQEGANMLLRAGEDCVLYTVQDIRARFITE